MKTPGSGDSRRLFEPPITCRYLDITATRHEGTRIERPAFASIRVHSRFRFACPHADTAIRRHADSLRLRGNRGCVCRSAALALILPVGACFSYPKIPAVGYLANKPISTTVDSQLAKYWSFHNLRDIYLFTMKVMFYILWYAPGWEDVTTQYIGGDALSCYRSAPSGERCRGDREAAGFTLGQCITLAHKMAAGWTEGS